MLTVRALDRRLAALPGGDRGLDGRAAAGNEDLAAITSAPPVRRWSRLVDDARRVPGGLRLRLSAGARAAAFERELPAVLEAVAARLRAGGSLAQALAGAAPAASRSDLAEQWRRLVGDASAVGVEAALARWSATEGRPPSVALAAAALALAAGTGGSAARAVDGVASTLRARLAVAEEVRALSSQARASAAVIAAAPLVFGALAAIGDGRTVTFFFASPLGALLLVLGLALDAAGAWWMHRLCRVPS